MRILSIGQTPSVLPQGGNPAPSQGSQPSLSLRDISPKGRDEVTGWRLLQSFFHEISPVWLDIECCKYMILCHFRQEIFRIFYIISQNIYISIPCAACFLFGRMIK